MKNSFTTELLLCNCHSYQHQIIISYDNELEYVTLSIHLTNKSFFNRLVAGLKYIFGHKSKYGAWDEFVFDKSHIEPLKKVVNSLEEKNI